MIPRRRLPLGLGLALLAASTGNAERVSAGEASVTVADADTPRRLTSLSYEPVLPVGGSWDFAGNVSGRGVAMAYRMLLTPRWLVGLRGAWHVAAASDFGTWTRGAVTLTGTESRTWNSVPVEATFGYAWADVGARFAPFVSLGLGAAWAERRSEIATWRTSADAWHFTCSPEVGWYFPMDWAQALVALRFQYLAPSGYKPEETYLTLGIGIAER